MKNLLLAVACVLTLSFTAVLPVSTAEAAVTLPNYAQGGNITQDVQTKGKKITDLVSMIVAILAILGIFIGAGYYGVGKGDQGKVYVIGGLVGLLIAGSAYGIAALAL